MSILPDANWLNALKLPTQAMLGLFIASVLLLVLDGYGIVSLESFWKLGRPAVIILLVFSSALSLTGIGAFAIDQFTRRQKHSLLAQLRAEKEDKIELKRLEAQETALERLEHLSPGELRYLADCLRDGNQSFYTYVHSPTVSTLAAKGLVYTPGGTHHQDHYPFTIQDFAWKALLKKRDEIILQDEKNRKREADDKMRR